MKKFLIIALLLLLLAPPVYAVSADSETKEPITSGDFLADYTLIWDAGEGSDIDMDALWFEDGVMGIGNVILLYDSDAAILGGMVFFDSTKPNDMLYVIEAYSNGCDYSRTYKNDGTDFLMLDTIQFAETLMEVTTPGSAESFAYGNGLYRAVEVGDNVVIVFGGTDASLELMEMVLDSLSE